LGLGLCLRLVSGGAEESTASESRTECRSPTDGLLRIILSAEKSSASQITEKSPARTSLLLLLLSLRLLLLISAEISEESSTGSRLLIPKQSAAAAEIPKEPSACIDGTCISSVGACVTEEPSTGSTSLTRLVLVGVPKETTTSAEGIRSGFGSAED